MEYISATEASEKWGVSVRQVQRLLADNRIPGAKKYGRSWMIPCHADKPAALRRDSGLPEKSLSSDLSYVIASTTLPMPGNNPDGILEIMREERLRLQYEAELAYLRGDFARVIDCYRKTEGDEAVKLRACPVAAAAAISLGDYRAYTEIEAYLKGCIKAGQDGYIAPFAELILASVAVSVIAPNMAPEWLKEGDFSALPPQLNPQYILYLRAKYFLCIGQYETALAVAQTALAFSVAEQGITFMDIYLRVVWALTCHFLGREDEAKRILLAVMGITMPHGFITPLAEPVSDFGGLIEECLEETYPAYYDPLIAQWQNTVKNWVSFHNHFTQDNISMILSRREYYIAQLVARRVPYAEIAKLYGISVGRLKNIMLEIYEKLFISGRDELSQYITYKKQ